MKRELYRDPVDPTVFWVPVSSQLLAQMGEWSEPLQVRITEDGMVFRHPELDAEERVENFFDGQGVCPVCCCEGCDYPCGGNDCGCLNED